MQKKLRYTYLEIVLAFLAGILAPSINAFAIDDAGPIDAPADEEDETLTAVTEDEEGKLSSKVTYDADGIIFTNKTRPGSLHLTKNVDGLTEANKDDVFIFDIHLYNENGLPADGSIYWYIEGAEPAENTGGAEG